MPTAYSRPGLRPAWSTDPSRRHPMGRALGRWHCDFHPYLQSISEPQNVQDYHIAQNVHDLRMNHDEPLGHAYVGTLWMHWYNFIHNIHKHSYAVFIIKHIFTFSQRWDVWSHHILCQAWIKSARMTMASNPEMPDDVSICQFFCANAKH